MKEWLKNEWHMIPVALMPGSVCLAYLAAYYMGWLS